MSDTSSSGETGQRSIGWKSTLITCLVIAAVGGGLLYVIYNTEPTARRSAGTKTTAMLVDVTDVDTGTFRPTIEAMGTVEPAQDVILRPRINGRMIARSTKFQPGGIVEAGHTLFRIDPSDYRIVLQQSRSDLRQARSELKIEMGRQDVAQEEYELLEENLSDENRALVLRRPQLESARAQVESARAGVEQARLNLDRTSVEAPFDAQILSRNANVGSQLNAGDNVARLVGMDTYWVETTVPLKDLQWLTFPDTAGANGSRALIRNRSAWPDDVHRIGHVDQLVGELDDNARMARVLITVSDPLSRDTSTEKPRMIVGSFVETEIRGEKLKNVIRLQRDYVRDNETVWVMKDGKLDIRDVRIVFQDADHAYIKDGISPDEKVVTTNLSTVVDGAPLRLGESAPDSAESTDGSM